MAHTLEGLSNVTAQNDKKLASVLKLYMDGSVRLIRGLCQGLHCFVDYFCVLTFFAARGVCLQTLSLEVECYRASLQVAFL